MQTQNINGHTVTLEDDKSYYASRPMASRKDEVFTITIKDMAGNVAQEVDGLCLEEADDFLTTFNNGSSCYDGRIW